MKITNSSKATILYVDDNVVQSIQMVSKWDYELIKDNFKEYSKMHPKEQYEFIKTNRIKLSFNEVVETSPMGLCIMGLEENKIGQMILPLVQGVEHNIQVLKFN